MVTDLPQIGNIVKSNISQLITGLFWFGAPVTALASWDEGLSERDGIGMPFMQRAWVDNLPNMTMTIETILGSSNEIDVNDVAWDMNEYVLSLLNLEGYTDVTENRALLTSMALNFVANDVARGTFTYNIFRPTDALQEWFDVYSSESNILWGDGTQLFALTGSDVEVIVPDDPFTVLGIDGIRSASAQTSPQWTPIETTRRRAGFVPKMPISIDMSFELYNDYFIENQSLFRKNTILSDINIWKFRFIAPKIINVAQNNPSTGVRTWNISMRAKNIIKEI